MCVIKVIQTVTMRKLYKSTVIYTLFERQGNVGQVVGLLESVARPSFVNVWMSGPKLSFSIFEAQAVPFKDVWTFQKPLNMWKRSPFIVFLVKRVNSGLKPHVPDGKTGAFVTKKNVHSTFCNIGGKKQRIKTLFIKKKNFNWNNKFRVSLIIVSF